LCTDSADLKPATKNNNESHTNVAANIVASEEEDEEEADVSDDQDTDEDESSSSEEEEDSDLTPAERAREKVIKRIMVNTVNVVLTKVQSDR